MMSTFKRFGLMRLRAFSFIIIFSCSGTPVFASFTLDPTFGSGGKVTISFPDSSTTYNSGALKVFVQPNNRILVGGTFTNRTPDGALTGIAWVGYTPGGSLDPGFGSGGKITDWRSDAFTNFRDALMYADGSTLRMSQVFRLPVGSSTVSAVRLSPNGVIDSLFASNVSIGPCCFGFFSARPEQIAVRGDGKILALMTDQGEYFLYRLNPDGTRDSSFGNNGVVAIVFNKVSSPSIVQMLTFDNGKILIVGNDPSSNFSNFFMTRLTETGSRDKTFGHVGFLRVPFGPGLTGTVRAVAAQSDGNILLSGSVVGPDTDVWMARFRPNGRLDSTFGSSGIAIYDFAPGDVDFASSVLVSADGKIRIAGQLGQTSAATFLLARFSSTGSLEDQTNFAFSTGQFATASDLALQADDKVVVAGQARNPDIAINGNVFAVARLTE